MALNDSFETIKNAATDAAQAAASKAKNLAAIAKANLSILAEQDKQKKAYTELGKLYYRDFITGEEPDDAEYLPLCDKITETVKNIQQLRQAIAQIKAEGESEKDVLDAEVCEAVSEEEFQETSAPAETKIDVIVQEDDNP